MIFGWMIRQLHLQDGNKMDDAHLLLLIKGFLIILLLIGIKYKYSDDKSQKFYTYKPKPPTKPPYGYAPIPPPGKERRNPPIGGSNVMYRNDKNE